jgi:hypothetical protein
MELNNNENWKNDDFTNNLKEKIDHLNKALK